MTGTCSTCNLWCGSGDDKSSKCRATTRLFTMNRHESCEKWQERPLASVVVREGAEVTPEALREFLSEHFAKWQLPDAWAFVEAVPRTSVGKFDKKVLRKHYADGELDVVLAMD